MIAVDLDLGPPGKPRDKAVFGNVDHVARGRFAIILIMSLVVWNDGRNVLNERASAVNVDALNAKADPQNRLVCLFSNVEDGKVRRLPRSEERRVGKECRW